jgi:hypothetical protein
MYALVLAALSLSLVPAGSAKEVSFTRTPFLDQVGRMGSIHVL